MLSLEELHVTLYITITPLRCDRIGGAQEMLKVLEDAETLKF